MIAFDVTKVSAQKHHSGLVRVSERLRTGLTGLLGNGVVAVQWHVRRRTWVVAGTREELEIRDGDWLLTPELFCEEERPGFGAWIERHGPRTAAIFHDAIPLRLPEITWPQSVARHPGYMRLLAGFGRVFAVSEASGRELEGYWAWMGLGRTPPVSAITLGADGPASTRVTAPHDRTRSAHAVMVGILEPRKNQEGVLDALERLRAENVEVGVDFVGRINPHFGRPVARRIQQLARSGVRVALHEGLDDAGVARLVAGARFALLPSRAEGCGLPVLESLWAGLPILATALPSIEESARGGGCLLVPPDDPEALFGGMRRMLTDDALIRRLQAEACTRELPRWCDTAAAIASGLRAGAA